LGEVHGLVALEWLARDVVRTLEPLLAGRGRLLASVSRVTAMTGHTVLVTCASCAEWAIIPNSARHPFALEDLVLHLLNDELIAYDSWGSVSQKYVRGFRSVGRIAG
jgi:hypothetical protein